MTAKMVADYVKTQPGFGPSITKDVPATAPRSTLNNATLNEVSGLTITIANWKPNLILGSVLFDVTLTKTGLKDKTITNVTYSGWNPKTDQQRLDAVTAESK